MNERHQLASITGASSGIGLELARCFVEDRHDVILVSENRDELDRVAHELRQLRQRNVDTIVADLSTIEGVRHVQEEVGRRGRRDAKVVVPLEYKVQTAINQAIPDKIVARQSAKKHEPRDEERV